MPTYNDMTAVGYQTSGDESKTKPINTDEFPGDKMPQESKMKHKTKITYKSKGRHKEHR